MVVLVALVAGMLLLGGSREDDEPQRTVVSPQRLARVERQVEQIRGLRFKRPVRVEVMTPEEVRAYADREMRGASAQRSIATSGELMKLLGLIAPDVDFAQVNSDVFGEQVAGFYDPRRERLALVEGVGIDDATLAHELAHALEDQYFDLERLGGDADAGVVYDGDAATGETGLVEGTATLVMTRFLERNPDAVSFGDAFGQLLSASSARPLPPAVMRSLVFPYTAGQSFAERLYATTGDWRLLDNALRDRPPVSSAELIDPDRWLRVERPEAVALPPADAAGPGWRRVAQTTFGEVDLRELLVDALGERSAARVASSWTGGRLVLWRQGSLTDRDCAAPCRSRDALALRVRVDSPRAARKLRRQLDDWKWSTLGGDDTSAGSPIVRIGGDGLAEVALHGREVRIAMAPDAALLARLMR